MAARTGKGPAKDLLERAAQSRLQSRITAAIGLYGRIVEQDRNSREAFAGLARCHESMGDQKRALDLYRRAADLGALPLETYLDAAFLARDHGAFDKAASWLKEALYHHPRSEDLHEGLRAIIQACADMAQRIGQISKEATIHKTDHGVAGFVALHGDSGFYLDLNPDVRDSGLGAYFHWLNYGLQEGRVFPGIEASRRPVKPDAVRPWRHFTFGGKRIFLRQSRMTAQAWSYESVLASWRQQKMQQSGLILDFLRSGRSLPRISVVMPAYNTDIEHLRAAIESVRSQRYPHWELCIADDCSPSASVRKLLREYKSADRRIQTVFRRSNGGISAATNSALALATGDYVAFLDHDDLLDDCALVCIAKAIAQHPEARIIYTDEDKVSSGGQRFDAHFKPDWNREFLYGQNYISHLTVVDRALLHEVGGLRPTYDGAQDYDFLLRCIEVTEDRNIIHLPKVLYSWRASEGSTALSGAFKPYAWEAGRRALADHLRRTVDPYAMVERGPFPFSYRPTWFTRNQPLVSIIIPTRDQLPLLKACVDGILLLTTGCRFEVIIVDNGSADPAALDWLARIPQLDSRVRVLRYDRPFNYSAINNFAVAHCKGDVLAFVNNDIEVLTPGWLEELCSLALRPDVGCVGAKLLYADHTVQHAGVIIGVGGVAGHASHKSRHDAPGYFGRLQLRQEYSAVTAACLVMRREVFVEVDGFDEQALPVAFNDVDLCLKLRSRGYRLVWTPFAQLFHHESASRGSDETPKKRARFLREMKHMMRKWGTVTAMDPAYNINLSLERADFSLGAPKWEF
jgi:O-antigen biosynthesis protein